MTAVRTFRSNHKRRSLAGLWRNVFACPAFYFSVVISLLSFTSSVHAQSDLIDPAPPPLKIISKSERARLDAESDVKSRTKLSLELMNARITSAEKFSEAQDYPAVFRELGAFQGLMDNSLDYLSRRDPGSNKVLDNYKRLEIGLRGFGPRLEGIYRSIPQRYEEYVRKLMKYLRDARTKATDPLFSNAILPDSKTDQ